MVIHDITLKNIGPFKDASVQLTNDDEPIIPITIFTGENGAGKSIFIDSIRSLFMGRYSNLLERNIIRNKENFFISCHIEFDNQKREISSTKLDSEALETTYNALGFHICHEFRLPTTWILDYWTSKLSNDSFKISNIATLKPTDYLKESLLGIQKNTDVTRLLAFLDYLRGSDNQDEKEVGGKLFEVAVNIINNCLAHAKFSHISRITLQPIIKFGDIEITFEKLSSGNLYLIQRLLSLLYKAYAVYQLNKPNINIEDILKVPGLLLIDEIENHLHPKWQKSILSIIKKFFPNLQIILTTHSPFIVSSYYPAKVFVCKYHNGESHVEDESGNYANKPIEEILRTPLFDTDSFSNRISYLLNLRKHALQNKNIEQAEKAEKLLLEINPQYFSYLEIDELLKSLKKDESN